MRAAVVGHTEWIEFVRVPHLPLAGEIVHGLDGWSEPGGGGAVAAVQLAKLAGRASFFTALGNDDLGRRTERELSQMGLDISAAGRPEPSRRAITFIDSRGERTITVLGTRLSPSGDDPLPWSRLAQTDAVYLTAGDVGAVLAARKARVLVATSRILDLIKQSGVRLDALVGSASDHAERYRDGDLAITPGLVVRTEGSAGGTFQVAGEPRQTYRPAPLPGPLQDTYGCGDSFAAGLTYALGAGYPPGAAVGLAARCGAAVAAGRGPYRGQLRSDSLGSEQQLRARR